jgi:SAM-dependent methyltransferase
MIDTMDLRTTFNEVVERYDRFRPHYPQTLFDRLIADTQISPASSLLEIGPGTGQATKPLAKIGCAITAIELGATLAEKTRRALRQYDNVHILAGSFEDADLPASSYDLICSATAFHWVKDEYKFVKTAQLLKDRGYLAIIHTEHVSDEAGDAFFHASQPLYDRYTSSEPIHTPEAFRLPLTSNLKPPHIDGNLVKQTDFCVFPVTIPYTAEEYAGLLSTYSPILALSPASRQKFLASMQSLITERFEAMLEKRFAFTLTVVQKV